MNEGLGAGILKFDIIAKLLFGIEWIYIELEPEVFVVSFGIRYRDIEVVLKNCTKTINLDHRWCLGPKYVDFLIEYAQKFKKLVLG